MARDPIAQYTTQTVYGRLVVSGAGQAGRSMTTTWLYKKTTSSCSGVTGSDGVAAWRRAAEGLGARRAGTG